MLFNSIEYFIFLPIVFVCYWIFNQRLTIQNAIVLVASYVFYGMWDWRFLSLIILSSLVDYYAGTNIARSTDQVTRRRYLFLSLFVNLGVLFTFKYFDFFVQSFVDLANATGINANWNSLNWILPIGISFYTFQTLSYTIDIYKQRMKPTDSMLEFFTYVAFFPQLVAGPIERASNLLPQFSKQRKFDYAQALDGARQVLWGLFKKVAIADNCALFVDAIYANQSQLYGPVLIIGAVLFVFQIYCDFSGYTDVAIGTAKLFGFRLKQNFDNPYFSINSTDFWRRWHISMSTWFRDYVYQPLVLRLRDWRNVGLYVATLITFLLIGIWHGAKWTYVAFGFFQALVLLGEIMTLKWRKRFKKKKTGLSVYYFFSWLGTMVFWVFLCVIFRSDTLKSSCAYIRNSMFAPDVSWLQSITDLNLKLNNFWIVVAGFFFVLAVERINRGYDHGLKRLPSIGGIRFVFYMVLINFVFYNLTSDQAFIYFQF